MRTARLLKTWAVVVALAGIVASLALLDAPWLEAGGVLLSLTAGLLLRLVANVGQLVYDLKAELLAARQALEQRRAQVNEALRAYQAAPESLRRVLGELDAQVLDEESLLRLEGILGRLQRARDDLREELEQLPVTGAESTRPNLPAAPHAAADPEARRA
jgi:hypothetical protein